MRCRIARRWSAAPHVVRALLCMGVTVLVAGCSDDTTAPGKTHELDGPTVAVGSGTARVYVLEQGDTPTSVGIELSAGALDALPDSMAMWQLPMPAGAAAAPWDHAMLNWNPQGHPPPEIYGVPHFDFHFYTIPVDAQMAIPGGPDTETVAPQYVPKDYASEVVSVPAMGVHWADTLAAEYHGHPFDRTFIYGFFHKQMVFVEPMVTVAYLQSHPDVSMSVKQPAAYQAAGRYPLASAVRWDAARQTFRISLDSLTTH
jgi:Domain of unknown function (DUF5602)